MRILAITSWWPEPADNGIKLRLSRLIQALAVEHEVHLAALHQAMPADDACRKELSYCASAVAACAPITALSPGAQVTSLWSARPASVRAAWSEPFAALVRQGAAELCPDLVIAFELSSAPYALCVPTVPRVLDDLEMATLRDAYTLATGRQRLRRWLTWIKHRSYVRQMLQGFAGYTTVSSYEESLARTLAPAQMPAIMLPNGADLGSALPALSPEPDTLIYPGALSYHANLDAMRYFLAEIFPKIRSERPAVQLRITGQTTAAQIAALPNCEQVEFTGFVPDIRALVARSWAEVVPLREGSGTRLKILEALAVGTPVVSTSKGVEGLDLEPERHLLVADAPQAFAARTLQLLANHELRARLSEQGRSAVAERYDWQLIGAHFSAFIQELVKGRSHVRSAA